MNESNIIKSICTNRFEISLYELPNGKYCVGYYSLDKEPVIGNPVDLSIALYVFEKKLEQLRGMA